MLANHALVWIGISYDDIMLPSILYLILCSLYAVLGFIGEPVPGGLVILDIKIKSKNYFQIIFTCAFFVSVYNGYSKGTLLVTALIGLVPVLSAMTYGVLGRIFGINDPYEPMLFYVIVIFIPTAVIGLLLAALGYLIGNILIL